MNKRFNQLTKISLILIYLVIIAGAIVRMTGSGMGCPDWPKCFGYMIPPTEETELFFKPYHDYNKGEMILLNSERFYTALKDFKSEELIDLNNWNLFEKHDYVTYDPVHTWIEYLNRLIGALAGIPILFFTLISIYYWKDYKYLTLISLLTVLGMGFQAWLGKTVVDSNLLPTKISIHMIIALLIVALLVYLYAYTAPNNSKTTTTIRIKNLGIIALVLTLIQIGIGTQVREFIDIQIDSLGKEQVSQWLNPAPFKFYFHRTFSLLVVLVNGYLFYKLREINFSLNVFKWIVITLSCEVLTGILMYYLDFPFGSQPIHLLLASLLFGAQLYFLLQLFNHNINTTTDDI